MHLDRPAPRWIRRGPQLGDLGLHVIPHPPNPHPRRRSADTTDANRRRPASPHSRYWPRSRSRCGGQTVDADGHRRPARRPAHHRSPQAAGWSLRLVGLLHGCRRGVHHHQVLVAPPSGNCRSHCTRSAPSSRQNRDSHARNLRSSFAGRQRGRRSPGTISPSRAGDRYGEVRALFVLAGRPLRALRIGASGHPRSTTVGDDAGGAASAALGGRSQGASRARGTAAANRGNRPHPSAKIRAPPSGVDLSSMIARAPTSRG
jgi:hypothetical protein